MSSTFTLSAVPALLAALSLTAIPAEAAELPVAAPSHIAVDVAPAWSPGQDTAANHRWRRYRRNRVDVGDVVAGVLIIGGIAAIANAAKRERYRDRNGDWRYPDNRDYRSGDYRDDAGSRGLDRAVEQCVAEIERDQRVQRVDSVDRDGNGWRVTGSLYNGAGFTCSIGEDGRIENLDTGGQADPYRSGEAGSDYGAPEDRPYQEGGSDDRQWDDDRYSSERTRIEGEAEADMAEAPQYEYPESQDMAEPVEGDMELGTGYPGAD